MKKWILRDGGIVSAAKGAVFAPRVIITLLIALLIYITYTLFSVIAGVVYGLVYGVVKQDLFAVYDLMQSQWLIAFALLLTAALIVLTLVYVLRIEKRSAASMGLVRGGWLRQYAVGFALGLGLLMAAGAIPMWLIGPVEARGFSVMVAVYFTAFIVQSASEEIFFRGFLMPSIGTRIGVVWGVLISSFVFALAHIFNPGMTVTGFIAVFFIGLFLALYILRTGSLLGACAVHAAWNFGIGLISVISISGFTIDYAVWQFGEVVPTEDVNILGDPVDLIAIGVFIIGICLLLFAGKRRLVVPAPPAPAAEDTLPGGEAETLVPERQSSSSNGD